MIKRVKLREFIYAFEPSTYFEILDHTNDERIFSGTSADVMRWLNKTSNEFYIDFGKSLNYVFVKGSRVIVYPDFIINE